MSEPTVQDSTSGDIGTNAAKPLPVDLTIKNAFSSGGYNQGDVIEGYKSPEHKYITVAMPDQNFYDTNNWAGFLNYGIRIPMNYDDKKTIGWSDGNTNLTGGIKICVALSPENWIQFDNMDGYVVNAGPVDAGWRSLNMKKYNEKLSFLKKRTMGTFVGFPGIDISGPGAIFAELWLLIKDYLRDVSFGGTSLSDPRIRNLVQVLHKKDPKYTLLSPTRLFLALKNECANGSSLNMVSFLKKWVKNCMINNTPTLTYTESVETLFRRLAEKIVAKQAKIYKAFTSGKVLALKVAIFRKTVKAGEPVRTHDNPINPNFLTNLSLAKYFKPK